MLVCAFSCAYCTRDRGCSAHPVFPAPSFLGEGQKFTHNSGALRSEIASTCLDMESNRRESNGRTCLSEGPARNSLPARIESPSVPQKSPPEPMCFDEIHAPKTEFRSQADQGTQALAHPCAGRSVAGGLATGLAP